MQNSGIGRRRDTCNKIFLPDQSCEYLIVRVWSKHQTNPTNCAYRCDPRGAIVDTQLFVMQDEKGMNAMPRRELSSRPALVILNTFIADTYKGSEESLMRSTKRIDERRKRLRGYPRGCSDPQDGVTCESGSRKRYPSQGSVTRYSGREGLSSIFLRSVLM